MVNISQIFSIFKLIVIISLISLSLSIKRKDPNFRDNVVKKDKSLIAKIFHEMGSNVYDYNVNVDESDKKFLNKFLKFNGKDISIYSNIEDNEISKRIHLKGSDSYVDYLIEFNKIKVLFKEDEQTSFPFKVSGVIKVKLYRSGHVDPSIKISKVTGYKKIKSSISEELSHSTSLDGQKTDSESNNRALKAFRDNGKLTKDTNLFGMNNFDTKIYAEKITYAYESYVKSHVTIENQKEFEINYDSLISKADKSK